MNVQDRNWMGLMCAVLALAVPPGSGAQTLGKVGHVRPRPAPVEMQAVEDDPPAIMDVRPMPAEHRMPTGERPPLRRGPAAPLRHGDEPVAYAPVPVAAPSETIPEAVPSAAAMEDIADSMEVNDVHEEDTDVIVVDIRRPMKPAASDLLPEVEEYQPHTDVDTSSQYQSSEALVEIDALPLPPDEIIDVVEDDGDGTFEQAGEKGATSGKRAAPSPEEPAVRQVAQAFWDHLVKGDVDAAVRLGVEGTDELLEVTRIFGGLEFKGPHLWQIERVAVRGNLAKVMATREEEWGVSRDTLSLIKEGGTWKVVYGRQ